MTYALDTIGIIRSPFKQKFTVPRQPGLVDVPAVIAMCPPFDEPSMFAGLEEFSHIWLSFIFHQNLAQGWSQQVRPPRLGGNKKRGVFATRSTFRPNALGLSVVSLQGIRHSGRQLLIDIQGADLIDGTPIVDIKPYLPWADSIESASGGFASSKPIASISVNFSPQSRRQLADLHHQYPNLSQLIEDLLAQDPRPAYKKNQAKNQSFAVNLYDLNIKWRLEDESFLVTDISPIQA